MRSQLSFPNNQTMRTCWNFDASGPRRTLRLRWMLPKIEMHYGDERWFSGGHGYHDAAGKRGLLASKRCINPAVWLIFLSHHNSLYILPKSKVYNWMLSAFCANSKIRIARRSITCFEHLRAGQKYELCIRHVFRTSELHRGIRCSRTTRELQSTSPQKVHLLVWMGPSALPLLL